MNYLLDTNLVIWTTYLRNRLSPAAVNSIEAADTLSFSIINLWEVVIKTALRRSDFAFDARRVRRALLDAGYRELLISAEHAFTVAGLATIHRDPFDRMLIAQARSEGLILLTSDQTLAGYGESIELV